MSVPWLLDRAPYAPFLEPRTARPPGLMPLGDAPLVAADPDFAAQMAERARLLATEREAVIACLPEGRAPAEELRAHLVTQVRPPFAVGDGRWHRPDGGSVALDGAPLETLGAMTAEDWCLLLPDAASGEHRLVAAVLCFPSRWSLAEKIGRPLTAIHAPVPDYDAGLAARVNRVFAALAPGRPLWRVNWLVHARAELFLPLRAGEKGAPVPVGPETPLYLRTERQTLSRLPGTGAIAFGIKTSVTPLGRLTGAQAAALARELARLDPATVAYRAGGDLQRAALARLGALAVRAGMA